MRLSEADQGRALDVCTMLVSSVVDLHREIRRLRIGEGFQGDERSVGAKLSLRAVEEILAPAMDRLGAAQKAGLDALTVEHFEELDRATKNLAEFVKELRAIPQETT